MTSQSPWWKGAAVYQIYPRSFLDTNSDGVGDLKGVLKGLDHIADLGCDGVWLSPFFTSPMADFGYDVADYCNIDPIFGNLDDFDAVVARAQKLGLKIIIDQVYSHTSDQHAWFQTSRQSSENEKSNWYVWADAKPDGSPPNNWISVFGGPAWQWDERRGQYYLHNFLKEQPDLNFHDPAVQSAILDVAKFWLARGVDGFRLDVINYCTHEAGLRDNPPAEPIDKPRQDFFTQEHRYNCSQPENFSFISKLRALADQYGDICLLGEIFDDKPLARQIEYTSGADRLHTAYSFHLLEANKASPALFAEALKPWDKAEGWPSWSLGNHDVERFPTRLFDEHATTQQIKLTLAILLTMRGTSFLYQGDELGLPQAQVPPDRIQDPHSKRNLTGAGRDGARTPFPWTSAELNGGFSDAKTTWLPVDMAHLAKALDMQISDSQSVYQFTKSMIDLRKKFPALRTGDIRIVPKLDDMLAFERLNPDSNEIIFCAFNLTPQQKKIETKNNAKLLETRLGGTLKDSLLCLPPFMGAIAIYT